MIHDTAGARRAALSTRAIDPRYARHVTFALLTMAIGGCVLSPTGALEERARLADAGVAFEPPIEQRTLPDLPALATWKDVLSRAFLANGALEAAYFRWSAAIDRIDIAGAYPNSDINLGYSYAFSSERMKTFDRMTFLTGFDAMENLAFPMKVEQAARVALGDARTAGAAFRVAKFELQRRVLFAWSDYELQASTIALREEDLSLRRMLARQALIRAESGDRRREVLASELELTLAEDELRDMRSEHESTRAALNAMLVRDPGAPLGIADRGHEVRTAPPDDGVLLAAAAEMFPEVAMIGAEAGTREEALELARMRWIPDFNPSLMFTGTIMQTIGAMVVLPTTLGEIRGGIREAQAQLREAQALLRQSKSDRTGEYVGLVIMLRNIERKERLFAQGVLPALQRLSDEQARAYESGGATLGDVIESRRVLLDARLTLAQARAQADRIITDIECCLGIDIETLPRRPALGADANKPMESKMESANHE